MRRCCSFFRRCQSQKYDLRRRWRKRLEHGQNQGRGVGEKQGQFNLWAIQKYARKKTKRWAEIFWRSGQRHQSATVETRHMPGSCGSHMHRTCTLRHAVAIVAIRLQCDAINTCGSVSEPGSGGGIGGKIDNRTFSHVVENECEQSVVGPFRGSLYYQVQVRHGRKWVIGSSAAEARPTRRRFPVESAPSTPHGCGSDVVATERKLNVSDAKKFMRAIASDPDVEYVEPDVEMHGGTIPNDPDYSRQWAFSNQGGINAGEAWDITDGSGIVIAMVDNGVTHHSDLDANLLPGMDVRMGHRENSDGFNPGITTEICHVNWHGTTVAGVLAAVTNNGIGIAGTAGGAKVVPVRALDACASGVLSDVADGITWAAGGSVPGIPENKNPAKVVNVSIQGLGSCSATLQQAIDGATARGASVVAIAGNYERDASGIQPGNCKNVIVVGNVRENGMRGYLSGYGPLVDIAAPGMNIWTTSNNGAFVPGPRELRLLQRYFHWRHRSMSGVSLSRSVAPKSLAPFENARLAYQERPCVWSGTTGLSDWQRRA